MCFSPLTGTMTLLRQYLFSGPSAHINAFSLSFNACCCEKRKRKQLCEREMTEMYQICHVQAWNTENQRGTCSELDAVKANLGQEVLPGQVSVAVNSVTIVSDGDSLQPELLTCKDLTPPG